MSELNVYLVPTDEPANGQRGIGKKVVASLEKLGIIDGFYDESLGWYDCGDNSASLFTGVDEDDPAFEYAIIYDQKQAHFIPDSHSGGFGSKCSACGEDMDDPLYDFLNEQGEDEESDMIARTIACPSCGKLHPLAEIKAEIDTALARFFICFAVVETFDFNSDVVAELEAIIGAKLRVIRERL